GGNPLVCKGGGTVGAPDRSNGIRHRTSLAKMSRTRQSVQPAEPDRFFAGSETGHVSNRRWIGPAVHAVAPHRNPVQPVELNVWSGTFSAELPGPLAPMLRSNAATGAVPCTRAESPLPVRSSLTEKQWKPRSCVFGTGSGHPV